MANRKRPRSRPQPPPPPAAVYNMNAINVPVPVPLPVPAVSVPFTTISHTYNYGTDDQLSNMNSNTYNSYVTPVQLPDGNSSTYNNYAIDHQLRSESSPAYNIHVANDQLPSGSSHPYNKYVANDQLPSGSSQYAYNNYDQLPSGSSQYAFNNYDQLPSGSSYAYNIYVVDDQLPLPDGNGDRIENPNEDSDEYVQFDRETNEYFDSLPPGYRFCPTDSELINEYLKKKLDNVPLPRNKIHVANIYKYSPERISKIYQPTCGQTWYFFTPRDRKYSNGTRPNRAAGTGYWKATGADKQIIPHENQIIGFRKALVFYEGKAPNGLKLNWIMQEYRANSQPREKTSADDMRLDDFVLCRIYKNKKKENNNDELQNNNVELQTNNVELQNNNVELQTVCEDTNCSFVHYQEQIPTYSLQQNYANYATPIATVGTPVSSMPVYSETAAVDAAATAAIVPDNTASSSTQTGYDYYAHFQRQAFAGFDVDDCLCDDFQYNNDDGHDSSPSKRQKRN